VIKNRLYNNEMVVSYIVVRTWIFDVEDASQGEAVSDSW
jgi:hypothetical protein